MFPVHPKIDLYVAAHKLQNLVKAKDYSGNDLRQGGSRPLWNRKRCEVFDWRDEVGRE